MHGNKKKELPCVCVETFWRRMHARTFHYDLVRKTKYVPDMYTLTISQNTYGLDPFLLKIQILIEQMLGIKRCYTENITYKFDIWLLHHLKTKFNIPSYKKYPLNFRIQYLGACKYTPTISAFQRKHKWTFVIFATVVTSYTVQKNFRFTRDISIHIKSCHIYTQKRSSCLLVGTRAAHWRYTPNCPRYCI